MHTAQLVGHKLDGFLIKLKHRSKPDRLELEDGNEKHIYVRIEDGKYVYDRTETGYDPSQEV